jgi:hypothetical protein
MPCPTLCTTSGGLGGCANIEVGIANARTPAIAVPMSILRNISPPSILVLNFCSDDGKVRALFRLGIGGVLVRLC